MTNSVLLSYHSRCPRAEWHFREITPSQLSWHPRKTRSSASQSAANRSNESAFEPTTTARKDRYVVDKYFAVFLGVPRHAFSSTLGASIHRIAAMFPQIKFVAANGYNFQELCSRYSIRSFPKLLVFSDGQLVARASSHNDIVSLATDLARITKSMPRSLPAPRADAMFSARQSAAHQVDSFSIRRALDSITSMDLGQPVEFFMGHSQAARRYEAAAFVIAGAYTLLRMSLWIRSKVHTPRAGP